MDFLINCNIDGVRSPQQCNPTNTTGSGERFHCGKSCSIHSSIALFKDFESMKIVLCVKLPDSTPFDVLVLSVVSVIEVEVQSWRFIDPVV